MTHQQWQHQARQRLIESGHSPAEAHATARVALDWATRTRYAALKHPDAALDAQTSARLEAALRQLERRVPLPHVAGRAEFYGLQLEVSPATLIPRPETEFLVEAVLARLPQTARVADLGTGSGAIALALQKTRPDLKVWATELSPPALEIARRNAALHGAKVQFLPGTSDWLSPLQNLAPFDALVSNPPYIAAAALETLQPEVRHEPRGALDGGVDGLDPYRIFADKGRQLLKPDGFCAVELGDDQWDAARDLFVTAGWRVLPPVYDLQSIKRVLVACHA